MIIIAYINQTEATKMNLLNTAAYKSLNNIAQAFNDDYGFVPFTQDIDNFVSQSFKRS